MRQRCLVPLVALACAAGSTQAQTIRAVRIAENLTNPVWLGSPPGDSTRLFVIEINAGIRIIDHGILRDDYFLDLTAVLPSTGEALNGMAFHPDYASNGRFYLIYQDANADSWISQWQVSTDPNRADPSSELVLLGPVPQPHPLVHNWNCLAFGPDGTLYASTGDGGPANDPNNLGQDLGSLHGKLLRLDVDAASPHVPPDNPFVGLPGAREEIWAYGLRQPWRFSFDRSTGDLWIGDVGQGLWEELDFQPAGSLGGENYGWRCLEASHCTGLSGCECSDASLVGPIHEYPHSRTRCAVIGGHVYRGAAIPAVQGRYFFGDFCGAAVMSLTFDGQTVTDFQDHTQEIQPCGPDVIGPLTSFGEDADGELYVLTAGVRNVYRILPADRTSVRYCWAGANSVGPGAPIDHTGTTSVAANDFTLTVSGGPPGQNGLFFYGTGSSATPFGEGFRCVTGSTWRLGPPVTLGGSGSAVRPVDNQTPPAPEAEIEVGKTFCFQFWYRDPAAGGSGFNLSDALRVEFCP